MATHHTNLTRRGLLGTAAAALAAPAFAARRLSPSDKVNVAVIGAGGQGGVNMTKLTDQNIVATCDVDYNAVWRGMLDKRSRLLPGREALRDAYIAAAVRAEKAGFDGVEIHGAHGYILAQFLSAEINHREDGYGGNLENRARIITEIIDGIRAATKPDFQLGLRLSPERFGLKLAEIRDVAAEILRNGKIDFLDMSLWDVAKEPNEDEHKGRTLMSVFTELPRGQVRLGAAGKVMSGKDAAGVLDAGHQSGEHHRRQP